MIRKTLSQVKAATFCIELPNKNQKGMPTPMGTGFFISSDGWFVTAAHVIMENGKPRNDIDKSFLMKENEGLGNGCMCQFMTLEHVLPKYDIALIKVDFEKNSNKEWLNGKSEFPFIQTSTLPLEMGEPVYSFGYPLSESKVNTTGPMTIGVNELSPRVTSAIVSSNLDKTKMVMSSSDPKHYVLDKALNYGNSGGPIIATETGHVHAICSRFQPVAIPQAHLTDANGKMLAIMIPSLYGVVSSFNNKEIIDLLKSLHIPIKENN